MYTHVFWGAGIDMTYDLYDYENYAGRYSQKHAKNLTYDCQRTPVCAHCSMHSLDAVSTDPAALDSNMDVGA